VAAAQPKGINPLLAAYLTRLLAKPLQTKMVTSGVLFFVQEITASHLAGVPSPQPTAKSGTPQYDLEAALSRAKITPRAFALAIYGAFISAPLNHVLVGRLQKMFAGKTTPKDRLLQILTNSIFIAPITTVVYLASMAIIGGARTVDGVTKVVKAGFAPFMKVTCISSPLAQMFAQKFLPSELWVPFFNMVAFTMGTFFNTKVKIAQLKAARKAQKDKDTAENKGPVA